MAPSDNIVLVMRLYPVGWTFQGGLPGTAAGRLYGFGVDQVLMLEMVLPNGYHVRFGPTEWETAEGYDVPKTLKVSGVCRSNPSETDEDKKVCIAGDGGDLDEEQHRQERGCEFDYFHGRK